MDSFDKIIVKKYKGKVGKATELFRADASIMHHKGYRPIEQVYESGSYGCGSFLIALVLCFIIIGIAVFAYMLIVKPEGTLVVTYELKYKK